MATVPNTPRSNQITLASPSLGPFEVGFRLFESDAIEVYVNFIRVTSGYSVSASFAAGYDDNATIAFASSMPSGTVIHLFGDLAPGRGADYGLTDPLLTAKLNSEFARLWATLSEVNLRSKTGLRAFSEQASLQVQNDCVIVWDQENERFTSGPTTSKIEEAQGFASASQTSAGSSASSAAMAAGSLAAVQGIATQFGDVAGAITASENARDKSQEWAEKPEDVAVEAGQFSALHHAAKSAASLVQANEARDAAQGYAQTAAGVSRYADSWDGPGIQAINISGSVAWEVIEVGPGDGPGAMRNQATATGYDGPLVPKQGTNVRQVDWGRWIHVDRPTNKQINDDFDQIGNSLGAEILTRANADAALTAGLAETDNDVVDLGAALTAEEAARVASIAAVMLDLIVRGVAVGPTNDPEIAWGVGFAGDDKRSWLEILRATGGPTALAARLIARSLNFNDLTSAQLDLLASLLNIDMNLSDLSDEDIASLLDQLDLDFQNPSPELIAAVQDIAGNPNPDIIKVATAAPIISLSTEPHGPSREYPVWVKHLDAPVITLADVPGQTSFYWPCLFGLQEEGIDEYAMLSTTDHAQVHEDSGVILLTAPHPNGPWTYRGKIYRDDNGESKQTETAVPMWIKGKLHIFYQAYSDPAAGMGTGTQTSLYVTLEGPLFPNGIDNPPVNWIDNPEAFSAPKVAFDNFTDKYPGTGHTGYLTLFQIGADIFAHALQGGAGSGANAFCQWDDRDPNFDATFVPFPRRVMQESGTLIGTPAVMKNGQIYKMSPKRAMRIGRGGAVIGTTIDITPPAQAWEEGLVIMGATTVTVDGETFAAYRGGSTNSTHKIGIKKAV
tara:strand:- start:7752 stop:10283 length:2532 start_codon:yes stop_codon:yes gene_type:complete